MKITIVKNDTGKEMTAKIDGKLETRTAPEAKSKISAQLAGVTKLILDFRELDYISSAGIRLLIILLQKMEGKGEFIIKNVQESVMDVLTLVGIRDDLIIE